MDAGADYLVRYPVQIFNDFFGEFIMTNFSDWQLQNVEKFGIYFPRFQKIELSSVQIQDEFDKVASEDVNPLSDNGGSLGYCWYEWLANATAGIADQFRTEKESLLYAARHFAWEFPQLKMVVHSVRVDMEIEPEFYTDGYYFTVEFY